MKLEVKRGFVDRIKDFLVGKYAERKSFSFDKKKSANGELRSSYGPIIGYKDWDTFKREYNLNNVGHVGPEQGMRITDVYTCINILSQSIAWLPKALKRRNNTSGTETVTGTLNTLISKQPNSYMSAYNYWSKVGVDLWGWGNHYSVIMNRTMLSETWLMPLESWEVKPELQSDGQLIYRYKGQVIPSREMIHFRMFTKNGIDGISPIKQNANTMGYALRQQEYGHNAIGAQVHQYLRSDVPLDDAVKSAAGDALKKKILAGDIPVLDRLYLESMMINPDDAQYIETAKLTTEKIYGIFRVPPIFGQNYENANFANSEQQNLIFVQHALMPAITCIEQELNMKLLPVGENTRFFHVNANGLLRGDTQTRKEFYQTMLTLGVYSPKRVLELEDEQWDPGDDTKWIQGAMTPVDRAKQEPPQSDIVGGGVMNGGNND